MVLFTADLQRIPIPARLSRNGGRRKRQFDIKIAQVAGQPPRRIR